MVALSNIAKGRYREPNDKPSIADATSQLTTDWDPRVVAEFATTTARDTAYDAAINGTGVYSGSPKKGMRCFVNSGPAGYGDWCGWNGSEWIWDNPAPLTYNSGLVGGPTSSTTTAFQGVNSSPHTVTPSRSGKAILRIFVAAVSGSAGYGTGYLKMRYSSGDLLPGNTGFTVIEEKTAGQRRDELHEYPVPIYLTKNTPITLAFDIWSNNQGGPFWQLVAHQWFITQI